MAIGDNNLKIYYSDFILQGKIVSAGKDTLRIQWDDSEVHVVYLRWE